MKAVQPGTLSSLVVLAGFSLIAAGTTGSGTSTSSNSEEPSSATGAAAPAKKELTYVTESCLELSEKFGASSKLSDLQKEELWKDYKGKAFKWDLKVTEVSSDMFGGFSVQFKCAPESPSFIQDVQIKYPKEAKSTVMGLMKDETYTVEGVLKHSGALLGMTADAL